MGGFAMTTWLESSVVAATAWMVIVGANRWLPELA